MIKFLVFLAFIAIAAAVLPAVFSALFELVVLFLLTFVYTMLILAGIQVIVAVIAWLVSGKPLVKVSGTNADGTRWYRAY